LPRWIGVEAIMSRPNTNIVWTSVLAACVLLPPAASAQATCDTRSIDATSYRLSARALTALSIDDAERAVSIDPANLLGHGLLARQYVVDGIDARLADAAWRTVLDAGGAVVWTATLYDVDARSFFVTAFDRDTMRIFRYGELAGDVPAHLGVPEIAGPERERLWRALGGCIDETARPEAVIPWSDVREIKAGNWVLYFKLTRPVTIGSDRGKRKRVDEIKVNLHGATGTLDVLVSRDVVEPWKVSVRPMGIGPLNFQQRVRYTLVKFVDPAGRIALPKASRSAGW
jgi:hypothetical protein